MALCPLSELLPLLETVGAPAKPVRTNRSESKDSKSVYLHRESVSGLGGFSLGFVYRCARRVGSGLYQSASILYHLTTARRWRSGDTQRFGVLYSKFEFAVQDAIKTPKLKPRSRKRVLG